MRPHPVADAEPKVETPHPRVIQISAAPRTRPRPPDGPAARPEPWTPREGFVIPSPKRPEPVVPPPVVPFSLTPTHRLMLGAFFSICVGMALAMVVWRMSATPEPPERTVATAEPPTEEARIGPAIPPASGPAETRPAGTGSVTTEIRVLQPNYTVAPGDTLASIARRHGTTIEALASINNLENRNALSVGQKLIIP